MNKIDIKLESSYLRIKEKSQNTDKPQKINTKPAANIHCSSAACIANYNIAAQNIFFKGFNTDKNNIQLPQYWKDIEIFAAKGLSEIERKHSDKVAEMLSDRLLRDGFVSLNKEEALFTGLFSEEYLDSLKSIAPGADKNNLVIPLQQSDALKLDLYTVIQTFKKVIQKRQLTGDNPVKNSQIISPIEKEKDSSWIRKSNIEYTDISLASPDSTKKSGTMTDYLRILLATQADTIHFAPFTSYGKGEKSPYAINSLNTIEDSIVDKKCGLIPDDQMRMVVDCAHILNKKVLYDQLTHTTQFSHEVIHPKKCEFFRWAKFENTGKEINVNGRSYPEKTLSYTSKNTGEKISNQEKMQAEEVQQQIISEVRDIIQKMINRYESDTGKKVDTDIHKDLPEDLHNKIVSELIQEGFWTIPNSHYETLGTPEFIRYNYKDNYPVFASANPAPYDDYIFSGEDSEGKPMPYLLSGDLTQFKLYNNVGVNKFGIMQDKNPTLNKEVTDYFTNIFPEKVRKKYGFDGIRWDMVDKTFGFFAKDENGNITKIPTRITPEVLQKAIAKAKSKENGGHPAVANLLECYDTGALDEAGKCDTDLIFGWEVYVPNESDSLNYIHKVIFENTQRIENQRTVPVFHAFSQDDLNIPARGGSMAITLRHFVSKFGNAGKGIRPKYQVMGSAQGMERSVHEAIFRKKSGDPSWDTSPTGRWINNVYNNIEKFYKDKEVQDIILNGKMKYDSVKAFKDGTEKHTYDPDRNSITWQIESKDGSKKLVMLANDNVFEAPDEKIDVEIPILNQNEKVKSIKEINLYSAELPATEIKDNINNGKLKIQRLIPGEFKLYLVEK